MPSPRASADESQPAEAVPLNASLVMLDPIRVIFPALLVLTAEKH